MKKSHFTAKLLLIAAYLATICIFSLLDIPCLFLYFLKTPCPGCGMTRAILSALRLDFSSAFGYHPMFWAVPYIFVYLLKDGPIFRKKAVDTAVLCLIGTGFIINWLVKLI